MKLIFCPYCEDVVKLTRYDRSCICGASGGKYLEDGLHAEIRGKAVPVGIDNRSFVEALKLYEVGLNHNITAFLISKDSDRVKKV